MVPPQVGRLSVPLSAVGVYGKLAPGDGLAVLGGGPGVPAELAQAAGEWLRVFLSTRNRVVAAAHRLGGAWWVFRPEWDTLVDAAGRDLGFVAFAALPAGVAATELPGLLLDLAGIEISKARPPKLLHASPLAPHRSAATATALLALMLDGPATVPTFDEATAVIDATGRLTPEWIAFLPDQRPVRLPDGPGLVIGQDELPVDVELVRLVRDHGPDALFDLGLDELPALFPAPADRLRAIGSVLGRPEGPVLLTAEGAAWMAQTPAGRAAALAGLPGSEVAGWLSSPSGRPEDLPALADRLGPGHATAARRLLDGRPRASADYLHHFPDDPAGAVSLLGPDVGRFWVRLADEAAGPPTPAEAVWFLGEIAGLEPILSLGQLAGLAAADSSAEGLFLAALERAGLARADAIALLGPGPLRPSTPPPGLRPSAPWLAPFSAPRWLDAGPEVAADGAWRAWWLDGVRSLAQAARLGPDELLETGLRRRDQDLMALAGAPGSLRAWATTDRPVVLPPADGPWPPRANDLIAEALDRGDFFARAAGSNLIEALGWAAQRDPSRMELVLAGQFAADLREGRPAEPRWLALATSSLPRKVLLRQVAAHHLGPAGLGRGVALTALLAAPGLEAGEAAWLRALLLEGRPLGATPDWPAADLIELLPLLDPVRDVARLVLGRPARGDGEAELLARLIARLRANPALPLRGIPDLARAVRPDWVAALVELPGWEALADPDEAVARILAMVRALPDRARVALADLLSREVS